MPATRSRSATVEHVERADTLDACLQRIARAVGTLHPITRVSIRILDAQDPDFLILAGVWSADPTNLTPGTRIPIRSTSFHEVWRDGSALLFEETAPDRPPSLLDDILSGEGIRSWMTIPLRSGHLIVGLVSLSSPYAGAFTTDSQVQFAAIRDICEDRLLELARRERFVGADA